MRLLMILFLLSLVANAKNLNDCLPDDTGLRATITKNTTTGVYEVILLEDYQFTAIPETLPAGVYSSNESINEAIGWYFNEGADFNVVDNGNIKVLQFSGQFDSAQRFQFESIKFNCTK